jgi:beta-lactamase class A
VKAKHRARRRVPVRLVVLVGALVALVVTLPGQISDLISAHAGGPSQPSPSPSVVPSPSPTPPPWSLKHPFGPDFRSYMEGLENRVGAAVLDLTTGKIYVWHPHQTFDTGSIVKVQIAEAVLHRAQIEDRPLTAYEVDNMDSMITESDNDSATRLWNEVGGTVGVGEYDGEVGMTDTTLDYHWGLTTTTAPDNVRLLKNLIAPSPLLTRERQQYLLNLMKEVTDWQRWGVSSGPAADSTVALKNGWLPLPDERQWIVNSIGWVKGQGRNYVIAVLTDENPSQGYGISAIEQISSYVWNGLA